GQGKGPVVIRTLISQLASFALALFFALVVWVVATNEQNPNRQDYLAQALPVEIINRADNLVVYKQSVDTVRVQIRATEATWQNIRSTSFHATVDVGGRSGGTFRLPVQITSTDPQVTIIDSDPREVQVQLEPVTQATFTVRVQILDEPPVGFETRPPTVTPDRVRVSGPKVLLDQVTDAVAVIAIRGDKSPIDRDTGVVIQDAKGIQIQGLTLTPGTVKVQLPIAQRVGYKEVAIRPVMKGNVASGYWISNVTVEPNTATLVGPPDALGKIAGFIETQPIDVTDAGSFIIKRATITLPDGVTLLRDGGDITVRVTIDPLRGGQTIRRKIRLVNLAPTLRAKVSPDTVEVILSGPLPVLQALSANDVDLIVDLTGIGAGTVQLKPAAQLVPSALKVESVVPDTVEVVITR
ncbi:MAG TPA: CdaR family protein, partial [Anaerolineae bacterium]